MNQLFWRHGGSSMNQIVYFPNFFFTLSLHSTPSLDCALGRYSFSLLAQCVCEYVRQCTCAPLSSEKVRQSKLCPVLQHYPPAGTEQKGGEHCSPAQQLSPDTALDCTTQHGTRQCASDSSSRGKDGVLKYPSALSYPSLIKKKKTTTPVSNSQKSTHQQSLIPN